MRDTSRRRLVLLAALAVAALVLGGSLLSVQSVEGIAFIGGFGKESYTHGEDGSAAVRMIYGRTTYRVYSLYFALTDAGGTPVQVLPSKSSPLSGTGFSAVGPRPGNFLPAGDYIASFTAPAKDTTLTLALYAYVADSSACTDDGGPCPLAGSEKFVTYDSEFPYLRVWEGRAVVSPAPANAPPTPTQPQTGSTIIESTDTTGSGGGQGSPAGASFSGVPVYVWAGVAVAVLAAFYVVRRRGL